MENQEKKIKRIGFTVIPIIIFCIVFIETVFYYHENIPNPLYLLFLSIMNGIRIFIIRSTIDIFYIIQQDSSSHGLLRQVFDTLYVFCYFGAPIVTIKGLGQIYNYFADEKIIIRGRLGKKERVVIVGYNKHVETLIKNLIDSNKKQKKNQKKKILVLYKNEIASKQKFKYQLAGVLFREYEQLEFNNLVEKASATKELLRWMAPKKVKQVHIIFFEEKEMDNVSNYCFFLKCFEKEEKENRVAAWIDNWKKSKDLRLYCNYELPQVEQVIWKCFEKKKSLLDYKMHTFSLPMLRAQSVLEKHTIYESAIEGQKDVHLLIIGFGRMGQRFLQRAINQSVVSEKNRIIVDIVEKDIEKAKWCLERTCKSFYNREEDIVHVSSDVTEGDLKIRLHGLNISSSQFPECLEQLSEENPFTYIAICINSPEESIKCMFSIEDFLKVTDHTCPVMIRVDSSQKLSDLESLYENLYLVPGDDDIMTLENICNQSYWEIDENIHNEDGSMQQTEASAYKIESRKYRVLHYDAKKQIYDKIVLEEFETEKERLKTIFQEANEQKKEEFAGKVKNDELLQKLGAIEHRRWSYYMILHGWKHGVETDEEKEEKKVTPYLRPFAEILQDSNLKLSVYYEYKDWREINNKAIRDKEPNSSGKESRKKAGREKWRTQHGKR